MHPLLFALRFSCKAKEKGYEMNSSVTIFNFIILIKRMNPQLPVEPICNGDDGEEPAGLDVNSIQNKH
jgi:hypothetical protein